MKFGGRTYFVGTFAVVFHLAVIVGIFYAAWTSAPSVNAPSVNLDGPVRFTILRTKATKAPVLASELPIQPIAVRTIKIGAASAPPSASGPPGRFNYGPSFEHDMDSGIIAGPNKTRPHQAR